MTKKKEDVAVKLDVVVSAPKVTAVIPTWNNLALTKRLMESIARFWSVPYKLVFVDNGSTDGTKEWLKKIEEANPETVKCIFNHTNLGFAKATNQGMDHVEGHMLWLNNDVEFLRHGQIEMMVKALESDKGLGAVGPVTDVCMGWQHVRNQLKFPPFHGARFLIGFCMLVKEDAWRQVGRLEEGFNNAGQDDLDYSIRIRAAGFGLGVNREVFVHHMGGASQPQGPEYGKLEQEGREILKKKWGPEVVDELFLPIDLSNNRVLVAVPTWLSVYPESYANHSGSFMEEIKMARDTGLEIEFAPLLRSSIVTARNELVRKAIERGCTHLFFMDDDMLMPIGAIHKLLSRNKDIVSGLCHLRTPPHYPSAFFDPDDEDGKIFYIQDWWSHHPDELMQVDAVGSACVLIKTEVFQKIQEMKVPGVKDAGQDLWYLYGKARPGENTVGEDVFFCKLARDAGFEIWVDKTVSFGHIGPPRIYDTGYYRSQLEHVGPEFPGLIYNGYEATRKFAADSSSEALTPEDLAGKLGGDEARRVLAGQVGDGKNPGVQSAAGGKTPIQFRGAGRAV